VENQRAVSLTFAIAAVMVGVFARLLLIDVAVTMNWDVTLPSIADSNAMAQVVNVPGVVGLVCGGIAFFVLLRHERAGAFIDSVWSEMALVTWPSREETTRNTTIVIGASILFSVVLFIFDSSWVQVLRLFERVAG
jgi:preprotein translocase SecE subunit